MCAVPPRNLGKGAQTPPPLHPRLDIVADQASSLTAPIGTVPPAHRGQRENSFSPWNPIDRGRFRSPPTPRSAFGACGMTAPIDHAENCLSPWTAPCTGIIAARPRPGCAAPEPPQRFRTEARHAR